MTRRPILVTGTHRSGTTWTGALLSFSGEAFSIHEPLNPTYPRSWLSDRPDRWFEYITTDGDRWTKQFRRVVELRPPLLDMARRRVHPKHIARVAQEAVASTMARRRRSRALIKDPIAFFSAPWIANEFDADVVVLVRHPAAFASSLKRLDWRFDFTNLSDQPRLMNTLPTEHRDEIDAAVRQQPDVIDTAILLWRVFNSTVGRYRAEHPTWHVVRYEDLANSPIMAFESLYGALGLAWSDSVERAVAEHTGEGNVRTIADGDKGGVVRDSRAAMWTWHDRLTTDEIARIRQGVADVADTFYADSDWRLPA